MKNNIVPFYNNGVVYVLSNNWARANNSDTLVAHTYKEKYEYKYKIFL